MKISTHFRKFVSVLIVFAFLSVQILPAAYAQVALYQAQSLLGLPSVGTLVGLSDLFEPASIKAVEINPSNPLEFNFIISKGDEVLDDDEKQVKYNKLIKYFLASLTIPEDQMWVNLSPYENDRIIPEKFSYTEMGRDLLAQDYLLKQITASLLNPDEKIGRSFWDRIYDLAYEKYGTEDIPIDTFNKVWIVPDEALVYEEGNVAYLVKSHLKVMLEEDYLSQQNNQKERLSSDEDLLAIDKQENAKSIIREIIIPELEKEVNHGKHFALLRQITNSLILATWYKKTLKESLLGKVYVDKAKVDGIDIEDKTIKEKIYNQYVESFKNGVFNYIKEEYDPSTQQIIPRKYFSGGWNGNDYERITEVTKDRQRIPEEYFAGIRGELNSSNLDNTKVILNDDLSPVNDKKDPVDTSMLGNIYIPNVTKNINALSGEEFSLKISIEGEDKDISESIILHSNLGGAWVSKKGVVEKLGYRDGKNEYQVKLRIETDAAYEFAYTFAIEQNDGSMMWINDPRGERQYVETDGIVRVAPRFEGRAAAISMEFSAVAKRAGLGDAVYEKFVELAKSTDESTRPVVVVPRFKGRSKQLNYDKYIWTDVEGFEEIVGFKKRANVTVTAQKTIIDGVEVYALNVDDVSLFNDLYQNKDNEFYESVILSKAGLMLLKKLGLNEQLDVVEAHDHHTALVSLYMRSIFKDDFKDVASVFAINNIGYPGDYNTDLAEELGLQEFPEIEELLYIPNKEYKREIQLLAGAVGILGPGNYATTVSPTYAQQVINTPFGFTSDTRLKAAGKYFLGIMNGVSVELWNPKTDNKIHVNYSINDGIDSVLEARSQNKRSIQEYFSNKKNDGSYYGNLEVGSQRMLLGTNARLVKQKQMDILPQVIQKAKETKLPIDLVVLGDGEDNEKWIVDEIKRLAQETSDDVSIDINVVYSPFDVDIERMLLSGIDALLMPSDFEPSGLGQLKALLYGAIPIVRWTGGLIDSVIGEGSPQQTGFGFYGADRTFANPWEDNYRRDHNAQEFFNTIMRANRVYNENSGLWKQIVENAMNEDVGWKEGVKNHKVIYQLAKEDLNPQEILQLNAEFTYADAAILGLNRIDQTDDENLATREQNVGGIDLNPLNINFKIKRDDHNIPFPIEFQDIENLDIRGFTPVIINITPVTILPILFGKNTGSKEVLEVSLN
ncbi:MAG: hypothetical protein A2Y03_06775 [Omnitrophica WOR_2 bacterium GWF2_38_59]|nr:MAG: hypothetical protein A2Y03_06775 [Omnitrophica WOR_2 bacterium GWF2_38_59]OGX46848.1 MAG: hypothetical protein A2243_05820 [Omnitrophica WOR_2 bacterium RIFOXYA2_FULL_38_17]OGX53965.1 MAG: hypothetical protein A2267_02670 [Omnitrophica WOR_2 bacterium RIFOXYA12_FULL_38_10]HBG61538.1 hypothetical protein [Candidatus Omnitrophota bacterium]